MDDVEKLLDAGLKHDSGRENGRRDRSERHRTRSPGRDDDSRSHSSRSHHRRHRSRSYDRDDRDRRRRHRSPRDDYYHDERDRDRKRRRSRDDREPDYDGAADDGGGRSERREREREHRDYRRADEDRYRERDYHDRDRRRSSRRDEPYDDRDRRRPYDEPRHARDSPRAGRDSPRGPPPRDDSPQLTDTEHEMRSVFVSQLSMRVGDRELATFFEAQAGKVRDARVIVDRVSRRSKGVGYVEFRELDAVQKALALSGTKLLGIPVMVQYTEAEKNRQAMAERALAFGGSGPNDPNSYARLYVGSLNFALTDDDLRQVFQPFGAIEYVDLHKDPMTGKSKGYAFVQFRQPQDARTAMEKMNNFALAGRPLRVEIKAQPPPGLMMTGGFTGGGGGRGGGGGYGGAEDRLEDPIGGNMNQITRIELMHKLARTDAPAGLSVTDMYRPNIPTAQTRSVLLKNMFNPEEETERGWDAELREDVKGECEGQYGPVVAIAVEKESAEGEIYITFDTIDSAQKAITGLNGRFFGGRSITANFISDALVTAHGGR